MSKVPSKDAARRGRTVELGAALVVLGERLELALQLKVDRHVGREDALDDDRADRRVDRLAHVAKKAVLGRNRKGLRARVVFQNRNVVVHDGQLGASVHLVHVVDARVREIVAKRGNEDGQQLNL